MNIISVKAVKGIRHRNFGHREPAAGVSPASNPVCIAHPGAVRPKVALGRNVWQRYMPDLNAVSRHEVAEGRKSA